jgi:hypothetical protein
VSDRVKALKELNSDNGDDGDENIISKDEILIVYQDEEKERFILVKSENDNEIKYVVKDDYIYLKKLKPEV